MHNRVAILLGIIVLYGITSTARSADENGPAGLQPGKDIPSPFQALSVIHPNDKYQGRFHSPVAEFGLNPAVLIFVNQPGDPEKFGALLQKVDEAIAKNTQIELGCAVIFLNDGGYREALVNKTDALTEAMAAREMEEAKVKAVGKDLKNVAFSLYSAGGPKDFQLDPAVDFTVLVYTKQRVKANFTFSKDKPLDDTAIQAILDEVAKVIAPEKPQKPARAEAQRGA